MSRLLTQGCGFLSARFIETFFDRHDQCSGNVAFDSSDLESHRPAHDRRTHMKLEASNEPEFTDHYQRLLASGNLLGSASEFAVPSWIGED